MTNNKAPLAVTLPKDLIAGLVVFLVAIPLCLGIALASNAPPIAGIIAGIVGGILVGALSGSHTSVSGPAAGLTAVVAMQIGKLGTFEAFLVAVVMAGLIQLILGACRAGFIAAFFPSSVIKGLLAAIGVIIIIKQIPHFLGHDSDPVGEMAFAQPDRENTFSELWSSLLDIQPGALLVGILSILLIVGWGKIKTLKSSPVPAPLIVVLLGVALNYVFRQIGGSWAIDSTHLVAVPVTAGPADFIQKGLIFPDWSALSMPAVYLSALTIALVASLETLLNIEAVDKIDAEQRSTPPNRELLAQGAGNIVSGLIGGLPMTSVIIRSSANINAGARTKISTIWHGLLLLGCVMLVPVWLNQIPLAALAAILIMIGIKLASPKLMKQMWREGTNQFVPFIVTILAIVFTDLLIGTLIGLAVAIGFILHRNIHRPIRQIQEKHVAGEVLRIKLSHQVSFLNRAALDQTLRSVPRGTQMLLDARGTDYIDPEVLDLIADFKNTTAPALGIQFSLVGFKDKYPQIEDHIQYIDYSSREVQGALTPAAVLEILQAGNQRLLEGKRIRRDYSRQVDATAAGQFPMAAVLGCIDSRAPAEVIFDLGLGDIFSARVAGNIATTELLGSLEFACAVAGAKLIVVLGHTSCGAVNAAVDLLGAAKKASEATPCCNLDTLITEIQTSVDVTTLKKADQWLPGEKQAFANEVSRRNVLSTMRKIRARSRTLDGLVKEGKLAIVGALYDIQTGQASFFQTAESSQTALSIPMVSLV